MWTVLAILPISEIGGDVGHEFHRLQLGLLFEEEGEQHQAVAQGAGNHDAVQAAELVGQQIVTKSPLAPDRNTLGSARREWRSPAR
jgi:hypothetical protein